VERVELLQLSAEAARRQWKLDEVREVALVLVPGDLALAAGHGGRAESAFKPPVCSTRLDAVEVKKLRQLRGAEYAAAQGGRRSDAR
jgi:hypothetical protein